MPDLDASSLLDRIDAIHDDEPAQAAELLRALDIAALPQARHANLAFLFNHVLGEKLSQWSEANARQQALLALGASTPVLLRQAAVAAREAGDAPRAEALIASLADSAQADPAQAVQIVALACAMFEVPGLPATAAAQRALTAFGALDAAPAWSQATPFDAAAAAACNNIASDLMERAAHELALAPVRAAIAQGALWSQRLWQRAGTWVHHERSFYLRAMASQALGEPHRALEHARAGLAVLDEHDADRQQNVDRAFLELELAHASKRLGLVPEANAADARAQQLADAFGDASLTKWFEGRRAKLAAMRQG